MAPTTSFQVECLIHRFSGSGLSGKKIQEKLKEKGFYRSIKTIYNVINCNGLKREAMMNGTEWKYQRERKVLDRKVLNVIKRKFTSEDPPTFRELSNRINIPKSTIHDGVTKYLQMKKKKKRPVHIITPRDVQNRKTNVRKLYERLLSGKKSKWIVTLDEAYVHVRTKGKKRDHYYVSISKKYDEDVPIAVNENFPDRFMIIGAMCEDRTFPLIQAPYKVKCNAEFYVDYVLRPLIEIHLKSHFGSDLDKVTIHHDKATSHTADHTTNFLNEMNEKYGISFIAKKDIPVKGCDVSPMDFFGFAYIKQAVAKSRASTPEGVWKKCCEVWNSVVATVCKKVFNSWKRRCRAVKRMKGGVVEHIYNIHERKINV